MVRVHSKSIFARRRVGGSAWATRFWEGSPAATLLEEVSRAPADTALRMLASDARGLSEGEVERRLRIYGPNEVAHERPVPWPLMFLHNLKNPFVVVLALLGLVSYVTRDIKGTIVVAGMVALSVLMRFIQEFRSSRAAQVLRAMVSTTATVTRRYANGSADGVGEVVSQKREIRFDELVPGDVLHVSAGDMLPADVRFLSAKDLFVSQAALTGEAMPVEKYDTLSKVAVKAADVLRHADGNPLDAPTLGFMGTNVLGGSATAVVVATGQRTYFGSLAKSVVGHRGLTIPFLQSIATAPVVLSTAAVMAIGIGLPFSHAGAAIGMVHLPWAYFSWLAVILLGYSGLTQAVKVWYIRRFGSWL